MILRVLHLDILTRQVVSNAVLPAVHLDDLFLIVLHVPFPIHSLAELYSCYWILAAGSLLQNPFCYMLAVASLLLSPCLPCLCYCILAAESLLLLPDCLITAAESLLLRH